MNAMNVLLDGLLAPATRLIDLGDSVSLYWLIAAVLFTLTAHGLLRRRRGRGLLPLGVFARFAFPRRVFLHPSARLDYKLYVINSFLLATVLGLFVLGAQEWKNLFLGAIERAIGPGAQGGMPSWSVFFLTTGCQLLALDFGYWLAHFAFHKSPVLWEFHKVHHSAEVMTPATELRQHPVELIVFPLVYGLTSGATYAVMIHVFGAEAQMLGLFGQNLILVTHLATFHHLRHSHVRMPFNGLWGKLLHSPAHHHIHHSAAPHHFDKNLGFLFSLWDWMFGTLHVPDPRERIILGIGVEGETHSSVAQVMWQPIRQAGRLLVRRRPRTRRDDSPADRAVPSGRHG